MLLEYARAEKDAYAGDDSLPTETVDGSPTLFPRDGGEPFFGCLPSFDRLQFSASGPIERETGSRFLSSTNSFCFLLLLFGLPASSFFGGGLLPRADFGVAIAHVVGELGLRRRFAGRLRFDGHAFEQRKARWRRLFCESSRSTVVRQTHQDATGSREYRLRWRVAALCE